MACVFLSAPSGCVRKKAQPGRYDVAATSVTFSPDPVRLGDRVVFDYKVSKLGARDSSVPTFTVELSVDGRSVCFHRTSFSRACVGSTCPKAPGEWHFEAAAAGWHEYELVVDESNRLKETDESNNVLRGKFKVFPKGKAISPLASSVAGFEQPDYAAWQKLKDGMSEEEVLELLGEPLQKEERDPRPLHAYKWGYGTVLKPSDQYPDDASFYVWFVQGKVMDFGDPFDGVFSKDGKPTTPKLIVPFDKQVFDHYPGFVDFRWAVASGKYPMKYEVQVDSKYWHLDDKLSDEWDSFVNTTDIPYFLDTFGGEGKVRWRVRAVNSLGAGEWSEFRHFCFPLTE